MPKFHLPVPAGVLWSTRGHLLSCHPFGPYHRIQFPLQFTSLTGTTHEITPTKQKSEADPSLGSWRSRFRAQNALNALKRRARPRLQSYRLPPSSGPVGLGSHSPLCFQAAGKGRGSRPHRAAAAALTAPPPPAASAARGGSIRFGREPWPPPLGGRAAATSA